MKLTFTDKARDMVVSFMDMEEDGLQALRIAVDGSPFAPNYELTLVDAEQRAETDVEVDAGSFTVLVDEASVERLNGAEVDFVEKIQESGFQITPDPNATKAAIDDAGPSGKLAERVSHVLDTEINPAIAAHGGVINLVDVQGTEIFIEMAGGVSGVRDVAHDAASGCGAHGVAVGAGGDRDPRRDRPRERGESLLLVRWRR